MRGGMRRPNRLFMMIPVFVTVLCGQTPQPHAGWKLVPGGENLIGNGYWDQWVSVSAPATVQVSNGVLTATASDGYLGDTNVLAPYLETRSEEHTSELQSLRHLVCRLLLEKKNK